MIEVGRRQQDATEQGDPHQAPVGTAGILLQQQEQSRQQPAGHGYAEKGTEAMGVNDADADHYAGDDGIGAGLRGKGVDGHQQYVGQAQGQSGQGIADIEQDRPAPVQALFRGAVVVQAGDAHAQQGQPADRGEPAEDQPG